MVGDGSVRGYGGEVRVWDTGYRIWSGGKRKRRGKVPDARRARWKLYKKGRRLKENPWLNGVGNVTCNYHCLYGVAV